ncbi:restriction endonuclease subunit S [Cupriavidus sp. H18C2]|uniref:restriction endonuclease subunit S n=1 Tax=Cupriavidus sp. H18C2 TaxID=3241602 RepID=UPI003BF7E262
MNLRKGFDLLAAAPDGVARLRELILSLAVQGKLVPQDTNDEPTSTLLEKASANRERLIEEGQIRRERALAAISKSEIPYSLPRGWEWIRLGTIGQIVGGGTPKSDVPEYWADGDVPWLTPADLYGFKGKRISGGRRNISRQGLANSSAQLLPADTVLFSSRAPIGYVAIAANALATNQGFKSCVPYVEGTSDYLYWFLKSAAKAIDAAASGTTFKEISGGDFAKVLLPLPPLAEQGRIVAKVDELMRLCDALEANGRLEAEQHARLTTTLLEALAASESAHALAENWSRLAASFDLLLDRPEAVDALEQTVLQLAVRGLLVSADKNDEPVDVLLEHIREEKSCKIAARKANGGKTRTGVLEEERPFEIPTHWAWCSLGELTLIGPNNGFSPKPSPVDTGVRCLSLSATTKGYFREDCFKFVDIPSASAEQYLLKKGDLLIQRANSLDYVGMAAVYDMEDDRFMYPDLMMRLRVSSKLHVYFVHMYLISNFGRQYFKGKATGTQGTMPKINQGVVLNMPIPIPPAAEQARIVDRVTELRGLCASLRARLTDRQSCQARFAAALVEQTAAGGPGAGDLALAA